MQSVDLNCDCGESFGVYQMGDDAAMLSLVSSANVACGFHAGDPEVMATAFRIAKDHGVAVGAHPSFPDLWGFGRRRLPFSNGEIERLVAYQIGAAQGLAAYAGHKITHVKPHGALSNIAMEEVDVARAIARAVRAVDTGLAFLVVARSAMEQAGMAEGLRTVSEVFADRAYTDAGFLMPRDQAGAVLHDATEVADRVLAMITGGALIAASGKRIVVPIDSVCVHGDTPNAVAMANAVRQKLEAAGIAVKAFAAA
jgi:5-oxoprolinase (ATP-hydrolysing) subunit A